MFDGLTSVQVDRSRGVHVKVDRDPRSAVLYIDIESGGQLALSIDPARDQLRSLEVDLSLADGADAQVFIAIQENFRCKTVQKHTGSGGTSRVEVRCVADGRAVIDYRGEIDVPAGVSNVCAELHCRGLLLSDEAKVNALPIMKISSRDAECTHGVAVGGLDPELLMYYFSRGVDYAAARSEIVAGFLSPAS